MASAAIMMRRLVSRGSARTVSAAETPQDARPPAACLSLMPPPHPVDLSGYSSLTALFFVCSQHRHSKAIGRRDHNNYMVSTNSPHGSLANAVGTGRLT